MSAGSFNEIPASIERLLPSGQTFLECFLMTIFTSDLFDSALLDPVRKGCDELIVLSGYSNASVVNHFLGECDRLRLPAPAVKLIIGMGHQIGGLTLRGLRQLEADAQSRFSCGVISEAPYVHSKVYLWLRQGEPQTAFLGSANFSQNGLLGLQREVLTEVDATDAQLVIDGESARAVSCSDASLDEMINVSELESLTNFGGVALRDSSSLQSVTISLVTDKRGPLRVPERSGLNWGNRPEHNRDPNQAELRVTAEINRSKFFPPVGVHFSVLTDDGEVFNCVRAQSGGKAIESNPSNAALGRYFRRRLGLASGSVVTLEDLDRYGRRDVTFFRVDEHEFLLDFSR